MKDWTRNIVLVIGANGFLGPFFLYYVVVKLASVTSMKVAMSLHVALPNMFYSTVHECTIIKRIFTWHFIGFALGSLWVRFA